MEPYQVIDEHVIELLILKNLFEFWQYYSTTPYFVRLLTILIDYLNFDNITVLSLGYAF